MRLLPVVISFGLMNCAVAEPYPTIDTVTMVVNCMAELGGQNEENLYTCSCRQDVLSENLSFKEYESGNLYERYRNMPGEKGAEFRDSLNGEKFARKVKEARNMAVASCPVVKHLEPVAGKTVNE